MTLRAQPPKRQKTRRMPSPRKPRPEARSILDQLQKPLRVYELARKMADALAQLPTDVSPLYKQILMINGTQSIPYEVRMEVAELMPVQNWYFKDPNPAEGSRERALEVFNTLNTILDKASQAQTYKRHEAAWNIHVHSPLLELVFRWSIPHYGEITEPCARVESAMSAAIAGNSVPLRRSDPNTAPEPACSLSLDSELLNSDTSQDSWAPSDWSISQLRSHSAKVDYVVALDIPDNTQLREVISWTIDNAGLRRHVNHTTYAPLKESPIAISFEMKTEAGAGDSFAQLGIWAAAWHKRMFEGINGTFVFACDRGSSIDVYGPVTLGSTDRILSIYALLQSLEAMREWVVGTYNTSMKEWFLGADADE
ncbi:hypothetical protein F5883DRAFT_688463 [Diaporthe sp. PMI_573]|nr:hypothetical protein F5883DRAFT_688463 [Diaporthaceae sp. PMI_573]